MMRSYNNFYLLIFLAFTSFSGFGQNSYELGLQALNAGRKSEALRMFQNAVLHETYEMKGKDIPVAYAQMALIRNDYLEKKLENGTFKTIKENPGLMKSAIADINSAIDFHDKSAKGLIQKASKKLVKNATKIGEIVMDSLLQLDFENKAPESLELAALLNYELKDLTTIDSDNWKLHDILGFTHYMLNDMDFAMLEFKRGREIYNQMGSPDRSPLHLYNCMYSAKYHYKESKNFLEAKQAARDGKAYIALLMQDAGNNLDQVRKLAGLEATLSSIESRAENVDSISSTKD